MKYKIFQPYYKEHQLQVLCYKYFTPYNNLKNDRPELREYHIFKEAIATGKTADLDAWGFFSWSWEEKTRTNPKDFVDWMNANPGNDVYLINHGRVQEALSLNIWEQGEWFHPKIAEATQSILATMGYNINLLATPMTRNNYCFCSNFIATKEFWKDYLEFVDEFIMALEDCDPKTKIIVKGNANYTKDSSLDYFPFIIERLFSTYLLLNEKKYKVAAFPYIYDVYHKYLASLEYKDVFSFLNALSLLKQSGVTLKDALIMDKWHELRKVFLEKHNAIINLDG